MLSHTGAFRLMRDVWIYVRHLDVWGCMDILRATDVWGCMAVWEHMDLGPTDTHQTYRQLDISPYACQLHLKEYVKVFLSLVFDHEPLLWTSYMFLMSPLYWTLYLTIVIV